jgi:UPF0176 protein
MLIVAALYHFARLPDPAGARPTLLHLMQEQGVKGTLILAGEGVNGTIAGTRAGIDAVLAHLRSWPGFAELVWKESPATDMPFQRSKVKIKAEIVTLGLPGIDPTARTGHRVAPLDWNALVRAPDVAVIDTRNTYEVAIGTFQGAVDPGTRQFRDFPAWWADNAQAFAGKRIAMFCTGGIRCEKSTNFLLSQGVSQVFHLQGGILKYLEQVPKDQSLWQGECFVFDERVSVTHGLGPGTAQMCAGCGRPHFGEACPACAGVSHTS